MVLAQDDSCLLRGPKCGLHLYGHSPVDKYRPPPVLNPTPVAKKAGRRIAQLIFMRLETEPKVAYGEPGSGSHYPGQRGTTKAPD